jgi:hypothetical protein
MIRQKVQPSKESQILKIYNTDRSKLEASDFIVQLNKKFNELTICIEFNTHIK